MTTAAQQQQHETDVPLVDELQALRRTLRHDPQKHRFQTKASLWLTVVTVALLGILSLIFAPPMDQDDRHLQQDDDNKEDYSDSSCHDLWDIVPTPGAAQCAFVRTCNEGEGMWLTFVFCSTSMKWTTICGLLSPIILIWMVLLFRMLGSTAEDYFSPSLEMFSLKLGLPPRFAGVTLLALGNGAADVSATVNAFTSDTNKGYQLSLGALTGAAMFVGGVVSAVVVLVAGGVPCRGALVRDVCALLVTVVIVWVHLGRGMIGPEAISLFLSLYAMFVLLVLVADVYHRGVVVPRQRAVQRGQEREQQFAEGQLVQERAAESMNDLAQSQTMIEPQPSVNSNNGGNNNAPPPNSALGTMLAALSNYDQGIQPSNSADGGEPTSDGWGVDADDLGDRQPVIMQGIRHNHHQHPRLQHPHSPTRTHAPPAGETGTPYSMLEDATDRVCADQPHGPTAGVIAYNWSDAWETGKEEMKEHASSIWEDVAWNGDLHPLDKFLLFCELPFTVMRKITVPIPCDGYYCRPLVALSMALSPPWLAYYFKREHELPMFTGIYLLYTSILWLVGILLGALILRYAPVGEGSMALFASTPIALYGFIIGATWIDIIAASLVKMLDFIGILFRIPGPIIGLTILAWGNSVADLSANVAMARKGLANMAMTACYAGPVFNILIGLGLGFSALMAQTGKSEIEVEVSPSVLTGFIFVALNTATFLGVGLGIGKGHIPQQHGYLALTLYSVYVVASIVAQYTQ